MEFSEKLQELRKRKQMTQEQLAKRLYVSRTAVSKWESGRGYPSIDSLKAMASFFGVTLDELISTDEAILVAETDNKRQQSNLRELVFGLLDLSVVMMLFLPLFSNMTDGVYLPTSILSVESMSIYVKVFGFALIGACSMLGVLTLALQSLEWRIFHKLKQPASLTLGTCIVLLFILSAHPYAALFAFLLLFIKAVIIMKRP